ILDVFTAAFAGPPYHQGLPDTARFNATLTRHARYTGFRCYVAEEGAGGRIVGFTYGYTALPGGWWYDLVAAALDRKTVDRWMGDAFEFVELAVHPDAQGHGLGARLHDTLLADLPYRTALLSTYQGETAARQLYRRRGWVPLLEHFYYPDGSVPMAILGLKLPLRPARG
ncbi:MAG TPA: GNAT family N-acetyltransferase, partial [Chloroflexia bacterium]